MKDYNDRVLKEQNKQKRGVHSNNVYDNDSNFYYSASRVRFDDSKFKNALTVTNWPQFQSKRQNMIKNSQSDDDDDNDGKTGKRRKNKHETRKKDLWKDAPPVTYRGYEKWLKQVETEITRVEQQSNDTSNIQTKNKRKHKNKSNRKNKTTFAKSPIVNTNKSVIKSADAHASVSPSVNNQLPKD